MLSLFDGYQRDVGTDPAPLRDVAIWALNKQLWQPRTVDMVDLLSEDLARALREEYRTDRRGRRYRAKHAVRRKLGNKTITLWADIDTAPRDHMVSAFAQRRKQIVGDCFQLKVDVDCYNSTRSTEQPMQIELNFTQDVAELQALEERGGSAA